VLAGHAAAQVWIERKDKFSQRFNTIKVMDSNTSAQTSYTYVIAQVVHDLLDTITPETSAKDLNKMCFTIDLCVTFFKQDDPE